MNFPDRHKCISFTRWLNHSASGLSNLTIQRSINSTVIGKYLNKIKMLKEKLLSGDDEGGGL